MAALTQADQEISVAYSNTISALTLELTVQALFTQEEQRWSRQTHTFLSAMEVMQASEFEKDRAEQMSQLIQTWKDDTLPTEKHSGDIARVS